ncbi:hypothetical protein J7E63_25940 [Bacillus sp. ISL-75]|uniref:hypothetical protein n=1 Tax=Bacillus sp. ISL-75 TaxID=2819137 RepID=UPI001BE68DA5|nr:hypothetical protein [Bacillus sp. ISL-75]MBT2730287.1 hypothetical protein [Bacillus sp. ISL-75]
MYNHVLLMRRAGRLLSQTGNGPFFRINEILAKLGNSILRRAGVTEGQIRILLEENPQSVLAVEAE